jgi:peptidoglycan/LPS O-acetylase OafA/YrhL
MTHVFVERRMFDAGYQLEKLFHIDLFTHRGIGGQDIVFLGTRLWHGDIAYLVYLALIIAMSFFTYRWIEKPAREWVRNRIHTRQRTAMSRSIAGA